MNNSKNAFPADYAVIASGEFSFLVSGYDFKVFATEAIVARVRGGVIVDRLSVAFSDFDPADLVPRDGRTPLSSEDALDLIISFIGGDVVIGHNKSSFYKQLSSRARNTGISSFGFYVDTMLLARRVFPDRKHHRLQDVSEYLGIDCSNVYNGTYPYDLPSVAALTVECYEKMKSL